ncbi:hypothetical protein [Labilibaculum euxinus]
MKKIILSILFCFTAFGLVSAQTQVTGGTSQKLTAVHTFGNTFAWTVVGDGTGTTVTIPETTNTVTFTWPTVADIYTVTVVTTDVNGCKSEPFEQKIQVLGDPTVEFADAGDVTGVCSAATTIAANGSTPVTVTYTGAQPWTLTYSILDNNDLVVAGFDNVEVANLNGDYIIDVVHNFVNNETTPQNWKVVINSAKSADDVVVNAADNDKNIVVYPLPVITNLTLN